MQRAIAAILLIAVLAIGGGLIATTAYQAGLSQAVTTTTDGTTVVTPVVGYGWGGYGYGWHPFGFGFGFFGFLGTLLFLFLIFGLIRATFFRGGPGRGGWGPGWGAGWGPRGGPGDHDARRKYWESRFGEGFDEWHRRSHEGGSSGEAPTSNTTSKPV